MWAVFLELPVIVVTKDNVTLIGRDYRTKLSSISKHAFPAAMVVVDFSNICHFVAPTYLGKVT
jgi:hypothetical protein